MNKEPIRIAQIIGKWVGGGVEANIMNYYRNIDRQKVQFDFICDEDSTSIPYKEIESLGGKVILVPPYQKMVKYHFELKKILKKGNYSIVHSHINALSVFPLFVAFLTGVPVRIAHSHSTTNKKEKMRHILKLILRPFSKLFATDYIGCSENAGRWLFGNRTFNKGKVLTLNNAIDLEKFRYNEEIRTQVRRQLDLSEDALVIGNVGRFVETKNHKFLLQIFKEIKAEKNNSVLILVGQGPLMDTIKKEVDNLGLSESVKFLGQRDDISELYQSFDLFILPSLYEGLGMVLIEAQVAGVPCFCSIEVSKDAKITDNITFIELSKNAKEWKNIILKNFDKQKRKSYHKDAAKCGYDIKIEAENLQNYYLEKSGKYE